MSKSDFVHAMQQQQGAHEPGASQLSSIHSRSSAHVNQIQGDSSAQGKLRAGIGMLMEQRPGALPMGLRRLSLRLRLPLHLLDPRLCGGTARSDQLTRACLGRLLGPRVDEGDLLAPHLTHRRC